MRTKLRRLDAVFKTVRHITSTLLTGVLLELSTEVGRLGALDAVCTVRDGTNIQSAEILPPLDPLQRTMDGYLGEWKAAAVRRRVEEEKKVATVDCDERWNRLSTGVHDGTDWRASVWGGAETRHLRVHQEE